MKKVILFSTLTNNNRDAIFAQLFPDDLKHRVLAYMPSGGVSGAEQYVAEWRDYASRFGADFVAIDNAATGKAALDERKKLLASNILVMSGGNTFTLLENLRKSGLDKAILAFAKKPEFILAGFSAGAIVLTPTIAVCNQPGYDDDPGKLDDLTGLGIVDFEVMPHYNKSLRHVLREYETMAGHGIRPIDEEEFIISQL